VLIMAILAVQAVQPVTVSSTAVSPAALAAPAGEDVRLQGLAAATERLRQQDASLVYGPGPENYLPLGMAFSFFLMWTLMGAGQPSTMVRLMSFKDAASNRRATGLLALYMLLTYLSLLVIFICARAIFPSEYLHDAGSEALGEPDSIMPAMARRLTRDLEGGAFLGGLLLAAPYAAIMSTVAAFLLMISSSLVRDLYQRVINPDVSTRTIKRISYAATALVGALVMFGALNPPAFLQYIIVFSGTALGCSFLVPMLLTLYWRRATRQGILAGMLGGSLTVASLYVLGWIDHGTRTAAREYETAIAQADPTNRPGPERPTTAYWLKENLSWISGWGERRESAIQPLYLGGMDALIWGMLMSLVLGVGVSLITRPDEELVRKYFPQPE
jgi:Na+/proline symporter